MNDAAILKRDEEPALPDPSPASGHTPSQIEPTGQDLGAIALDLVVDDAGFQALEPEWNQLFEASATPSQAFLSFAWNWHWCRHYMTDPGVDRRRLAIVTGRRGGQLVLVIPLVVYRRLGLATLAWMGAPVSQYGDVLADSGCVDTATLVEALGFVASRERSSVLYLRKVRDDALIAPALAILGSRVTAVEEAPFIDIKALHEAEPGQPVMLDARRRKNRRRLMRRLKSEATVEVTRHAQDEVAGQLAESAIRMKREWLTSKGAVSLALSDERFLEFFRDIATGRGRRVDCEVRCLRVSGSVAAAQILLRHRRSRFLHIVVYDQAFERHGVGSLLLEATIEDAVGNDVDVFDLLGPRHAYKMEFADRTMRVADHALGFDFAGRMKATLLLGGRRTVKGWIENLPAPARRVIAYGLRWKRPR